MAFWNVSTSDFLASTSFQGVGDIPSPENQEWASQMARYELAQEYFSGAIFKKRSSPKDPDSPLMYPLKINLVRMMCLTQAAALWGQWEDRLVDLTVTPERDNQAAKDRAADALKIVKETYDHSGMESLLYEGGLAQQTYGGVFFRNAIDLNAPWGVRIDKLMPYNVFPVWHPIQVDRILSARIVIPVDRHEASLAYGVRESDLPEQTVYQEIWTEGSYETWIGDKKLADFSGANPWGFVPIEYVPRIRLEGFYGLPLTEDLMGLQDEMNSRLADTGDNISGAAHPIRWIRNYKGNPEKDFELGADALVNLGSSMPGQDPPEIGVIPAQPEPASSFNFITFLLDMTRYSSFTSPVAFGVDEGSQRSGATLELRLWPMLKQAQATRIYYRTALLSLHRKLLKMVKERDIDSKIADGVVSRPVLLNFAPLVPRDRQMLVEEVTQRAAQDLISPEESMAKFGVVSGTEADEIRRIKEWMEFRAKVKKVAAPVAQPAGAPDETTDQQPTKEEA